MSSSTGIEGQDPHKEALEPATTKHPREVNPEDLSNSDSDEEYGEPAVRNLAIGNLAMDKLVTEKPAAEKLAAKKLAAEKLVAEKRAAEKRAAGKSVAGEPRENPIPNGEQIGEWLRDIITSHRKGLRKMYGETEEELGKCLKALIEQGEEIARRLIDDMKCTATVAKDLTVLTLYNVAILIGML